MNNKNKIITNNNSTKLFGIIIISVITLMMISTEMASAEVNELLLVIDEDVPFGELLLTIQNPLPEEVINFGGEIASTLDGNLVIGIPQYNTGNINEGSVAGVVIIVNGTTGELLLTIDNPSSSIDYFGSDVEIMPNGNLLVSASGYNEDGSLYLFDVNTGELLLTINDHVNISNNGDYIGATPDNNIILGSIYETRSFGTVYLFNGTSGEILLQIDNPSEDSGYAFGISVTSTNEGNLLISTSSNDSVNAVYLYDGITGEQLLTIPPPDGDWNPSIAVTHDNNLVIGDRYDEFIYIFDGTTGQQLIKITSPDSGLVQMGWDIEITPDGDILASNRIWEIGQPLAHLFNGTTGELLLSIDNPNSDLDETQSISTQVATIFDGKLIVSIPFASYDNGDRFLGEVYVFEGLTSNSDDDSPVITSIQSDDPDNLDDVYSVGDTITILFDSDTNTPGGTEPQEKAAVDDLFTFTESLGQAYSGQWITSDTFVITITNTTGVIPPIINYTTVTPSGITQILSADETSVPSTVTSPVLSGDFGERSLEEWIVDEEMIYYTGGNVGIGTTTPISKLQVIDGYIQLDTSFGEPPATDCNGIDKVGRMKVDSSNNNLYVCTNNGWQTYTP